MTAMEALFAQLIEHRFFFDFTVDEQSRRLRYLFWAHPRMAAHYARHPDVLIMDCTYKTNKYNMPLLNIIAMTGMNTVIPIAQCWLPGECGENFVWAFDRLKRLQRALNINLPR